MMNEVLTRTVRPLKVMCTQERPTSLPAPSGVMTIWSPSRPLEAGRFPAGGAPLGAAAEDAMVSPLPESARGLGFCPWCGGAAAGGLVDYHLPGPWADRSGFSIQPAQPDLDFFFLFLGFFLALFLGFS
jgi:hypothetical protein